MTAEKVIRLLLKALQLALSFLIVYCLLCVGPQWIMILACLIVPFFGVFLILKTPNKRCYVSKNTQQLITATESKNWTKVDFTLCFTMTIVFLGLSIIMFYGFFALLSRNVYLLIAGTASLVASMLYLFNALICLTQIRSLSRTINLASFASQDKILAQNSLTTSVVAPQTQYDRYIIDSASNKYITSKNIKTNSIRKHTKPSYVMEEYSAEKNIEAKKQKSDQSICNKLARWKHGIR
uniref:MARVEL domain-containing protein n=1 Tax=Syphacia muris TaxID=451379 RepID=A0A0N5ARC7_9BILA